jgi:hypothetical protein
MIVKYVQYNHLDPALELFVSRMNEMMYRNYASELLNSLLQSPDFDIENSVKRMIAVFRLTGIPIREHITAIYRSDFNGIRKDWKLSELACSLVILTSDSADLQVKNIQNDLLDYLGL